MNIEYWKEEQNKIQDISASYSPMLTLNYYEQHVKNLYDFVQNNLYSDFTKPKLAEAFGLILICISSARYTIEIIHKNPPAEKFTFKTLEEALDSLSRAIYSVKSLPDDLQSWRFIWRGLWVATFKSKISENHIIEYFDVDYVIREWLNNDITSHKNNNVNNTMVIIESLRKTGHDWDSISSIVGIDESTIKDDYINYLENK